MIAAVAFSSYQVSRKSISLFKPYVCYGIKTSIQTRGSDIPYTIKEVDKIISKKSAINILFNIMLNLICESVALYEKK
jgi:hypothetical protein